MLTDIQAHADHTGHSYPHAFTSTERSVCTQGAVSTQAHRHSRLAEINSQAWKNPHVPDYGLPPESPNVAFSPAARGAQQLGTGEGRAAGHQAGWASPLREVEKVPPGLGQSPKCTREGVGQSGSSLGGLPLPEGKSVEVGDEAGGHRCSHRPGAQEERRVHLCR